MSLNLGKTESLKREITMYSIFHIECIGIAHFLMLGADAFTKHVTDIEIFSKESKLVSLRSPPKKGLYMHVSDGLFLCDNHDPRV